MKNKKLQIQQLERRVKLFSAAGQLPRPTTGWIRAIRTALGMSLRQLGDKLSISRQSAQELEMREKEDSITLKSLREAANAMDMELVYGFVPRDGSMEAYIETKARKMASEIVLRTSNNMRLEDQQNSDERIEQAIEERTENIVRDMPKSLWD